jgi:centrosomal protein CEP76
VHEHAALLCSLLLGFGLDAYVCVGLSAEGPHYWVMTRNVVKGVPVFTFWESLTGQRYDQSIAAVAVR